MLLRYVVDVLLDKTPDTPPVKQIREQLVDWSGLVQETSGRRLSLVLTVPADSLFQAFSTAARIVAPYGEPSSMAVASEAARSKPDGWENVPDLVSVQEVATAAGKTKQAIFARISRGDLSARKVGQEFIVLRSDIL